MVTETTQIIADQNDAFRRFDPDIPGSRFLTAGIAELLKANDTPNALIVEAVADFDEFNEDNDPNGEHDFGKFEFLNQTCFWKIDLFDVYYHFHSSEPENLGKTQRVLTIMLADEY